MRNLGELSARVAPGSSRFFGCEGEHLSLEVAVGKLHRMPDDKPESLGSE